MADAVDELILKVILDNKSLQSSAKTVEKTIDNLSKNVSNSLKAGFGVAAVAFGLDFAKKAVENFAKVGTSLNYTSQSMKMNARELDVWQRIIQRVGGTADEATSSLSSFQSKLRSAIYKPDSTTLGVLQSWLGLTQEQIRKKPIGELTKDVFSAMKGMSQDKQQQIIAELGISESMRQAGMLPNFKELFEKLEKNSVWTDEAIKNSVELNSSILDLKDSINELTGIFRNVFMSAASKGLNFSNKFIKDDLKFVIKNLALEAKEKINTAGNYLNEKDMKPEIKALTKKMSVEEIAQMMKESGGKNSVGDHGASFGIFQIQPETASGSWGRKVTSQELMNPEFNLQTQRRLMSSYMKMSGGNYARALAMYNQGEVSGANYYDKNKHSKNYYAEDIKSMINNQLPRSSSLQPSQSYKNVSNSNQTYFNIKEIVMPNVQNKEGFVNSMKGSLSANNYAISSSNKA